MLVAFSAFALLALMQVFAKLLGEQDYNAVEITFFRNALGFAGLGVWLLASRKTHLLKTDRPFAHMSRGLLSTVALWLTFSAFHLMPMSETTIFIFGSSLMLPLLSTIFLHEKVGIYRWSSILVGFCGILMMAHPSGQVTMIGAIVAMLAAVAQAVGQIFLRWLGRTEHPITVLFYFLMIGSVFSAMVLPFFWKTPEPHAYLLIAGVAIAGTLGQLGLTVAFKYAVPSIVAPLNYTGLIWAVLFDLLIWSYVP
jgi:drug/metabolite transporter (DMT)-like permease